MPVAAAAPVGRPLVRPLRRIPYLAALDEMRAFTAARGPDTCDEIWLVEHEPVFTLGYASRPEHLLAPGEIPVVRTERGGQVTYHGPGQVLAYTLVDLRRRRLKLHVFVSLIEQAVIDVLARRHVTAMRRIGAPGVYVSTTSGEAGAKIASIGIKVSHGCTYHGLALNAAMDLEPFSRIDPCGYAGLAVTDLRSEVLARRDADPALGAPGVDTPGVATLAPELGAVLADLIEGSR
ncbi:MAG TPA: lipoyl(octanoyl) transferase LipB [Burkholderiaceae bacterium]|nr:lipoyl(octanoyl) transferase LipB [Burkholderiaceae bacterium]